MGFYNVNVTLVLVVLGSLMGLSRGHGTRVGFYSKSCPCAESIVQSTVRSHFRSNPTIAAGLLRMHFHDCFVEGCDASILIDGPGTEKTAGPNLLLRGYEVIDEAKRQIEAKCSGVVSCADILALAARDSVVVTGGASWAVPTGRRDGRVSQASATTNLPGFRDSVDVQKDKFLQKDLNTEDLVALVGGHTIGSSACRLFSYRLYNFSNGGPDPSINAAFLPTLRRLCPNGGDGTRRVGMDLGSETRFDAGYFGKLRDGRGVLESDQRLWGDATTRSVVQRFLGVNGVSFNAQFGKSMVKMSNIGVKVGTNGEIRRVCSAIN